MGYPNHQTCREKGFLTDALHAHDFAVVGSCQLQRQYVFGTKNCTTATAPKAPKPHANKNER
eukprot:110233-Amphidinium_carterae.1